ncbi:MAG: rhomboid family intramembrane serine protease [Cyclobacteriaceae bacterium]|nr:rhomboid family intramembrane serine protease [Cyclobacteriaceae bacterium]
MWLVYSVEFFYDLNFGFLGIKPRSVEGLVGIFTAPLIHGNYLHLLSNTIPLLFLGAVLYFFYDRIGGIVFFRCYFYTNILVWLFSPRPSYHIGASGLVYGLAAFLIFYGVIRQEFMSLLISVIIFMIYGGIFYGMLPSDPQISWESHLAGVLVGTFTAFNLGQKRKHG